MLAIVLGRRDTREADQYITIFTEEAGKRELLARGVKKITSKLSAYLMPFFVLDVEWVPGKENDLLITAQPYTTFRHIPESFEVLSVVNKCVVLVDRLTQVKQLEPKIFKLLASFLDAVDGAAAPCSALENSFIIKLLALLGWQPELARCLVCGEEVRDELVVFSVSEGGVVHAKCIHLFRSTKNVAVSLSSTERDSLENLLVGSWSEQVDGLPETVIKAVELFLHYHHAGAKIALPAVDGKH